MLSILKFVRSKFKWRHLKILLSQFCIVCALFVAEETSNSGPAKIDPLQLGRAFDNTNALPLLAKGRMFPAHL